MYKYMIMALILVTLAGCQNTAIQAAPTPTITAVVVEAEEPPPSPTIEEVGRAWIECTREAMSFLGLFTDSLSMHQELDFYNDWSIARWEAREAKAGFKECKDKLTFYRNEATRKVDNYIVGWLEVADLSINAMDAGYRYAASEGTDDAARLEMKDNLEEAQEKIDKLEVFHED